MPRHDEALILDMLLACRKIQQFTKGITQQAFENHQMTQSAILREIQVIGEAARLISEEAKAKHKAVEWHIIAGMRNRVVHEYFDVDLNIVWDTLQSDIPALMAYLEGVIPPEDENE